MTFAAYLTFNGNCRQAFHFYQQCLGGELQVQTLRDTPHGKNMSREMQSAVLSATLTNDFIRLVGTDLSDEGKVIAGNKVAILIYCDSYSERARLINKLVGRNFCSYKNQHPYINVTDLYNVHWILSIK